VLAAITSTQQRLKLYSRVPPNGLIVYCGTILTEEGKEKKVNFDFEPFKPISASLGRRNLDCSSEVSHSSWEVLAVLS